MGGGGGGGKDTTHVVLGSTPGACNKCVGARGYVRGACVRSREAGPMGAGGWRRRDNQASHGNEMREWLGKHGVRGMRK